MTTEKPSHHHYVEDNQDYVLFQIVCETCGFVFMEFVHYVPAPRYTYDPMEALSPARYEPYGMFQSRGAQSYAKPNMKIDCSISTRTHLVTEGAGDGGPIGCAVKSKGLTTAQFNEWRETGVHP